MGKSEHLTVAHKPQITLESTYVHSLQSTCLGQQSLDVNLNGNLISTPNNWSKRDASRPGQPECQAAASSAAISPQVLMTWALMVANSTRLHTATPPRSVRPTMSQTQKDWSAHSHTTLSARCLAMDCQEQAIAAGQKGHQAAQSLQDPTTSPSNSSSSSHTWNIQLHHRIARCHTPQMIACTRSLPLHSRTGRIDATVGQTPGHAELPGAPQSQTIQNEGSRAQADADMSIWPLTYKACKSARRPRADNHQGQH